MSDKEGSSDKDTLIQLLRKGMSNINESITSFRELGSEEMGYMKLHESSRQKIERFSNEVEKLKESLEQLEGNLVEANFKILLEQEYSSQLHENISGLEKQLYNLREEEEKKVAQIKDFTTKIQKIQEEITQKESEIEKLDSKIKEKENTIQEQKIEISEKEKIIEELAENNAKLSIEYDYKKEQVNELTTSITEKEQQIEKQTSQLEDLTGNLHDLLKEIGEKEELIKDQNKQIDLQNEKLMGLSEVMNIKDDLIIKKDQDLEEAKQKLKLYIEKEEQLLQEITKEEKIVALYLSENNKKLSYRKLLELCEDKLDGLRLILKKMKEKGIIEYEGMMAGFSSEITLVRDIS